MNGGGTVTTPSPAPPGITDIRQISPSLVNAFRITAVTDRLNKHIRSVPPPNDTVEFFNLCLSLARGIDYSVANNEVPAKVLDLPLLLKQVCQRKNDSLLQAAIMVLMISVKNACENGWFSDKDKEELCFLSNEIKSSFCSVKEINSEESSFLPTISTIFSRFYPQMRMGQILAFLEAKPGYGAFVKDFRISKTRKSSPEEKIRLFVAQTDNIETSSCLVSPPKVSFLLNGKGVEKRMNVSMDTGPQIPTAVNHMLKYGTNLIQAVGQFNGNYIIVVAYISKISNPGRPALPDFVQPTVVSLDSDIMEGPSRISLNCPISFRRINIPVKGHSCKHLQCFDFDNFMDINSRRPSWRCPHCNQSVCFPDIRIDQNMVKVLKEVGEDVADVIIAADGSWKTAIDGDSLKDKSTDVTPNGPVQDNPSCMLDSPVILDLTEANNEIDAISTHEREDIKPSPMDIENSNVTAVTSSMNQDVETHVEDDFWAGVYLSSQGLMVSSSGPDIQLNGGAESTPANNLTDSVSPALNQELQFFQERNLILNSDAQNQVSSHVSALNNMQLQQFENSNATSEYGRFPTIYRNAVSRTPIAIQALPAQASPGAPGSVERPQHLYRSNLVQLQGSQNRGNQDRAPNSNHPAQQMAGLSTPSQQQNGYRVSSALQAKHPNSYQLQSLNQRIPRTMSQAPSLVRAPAPHLSRTQIHQGVSQSGMAPTTSLGSSQPPRYAAAPSQGFPMGRQSPSMQAPVHSPRTTPSVPVSLDGSRPSVREQRGPGYMGVPPSQSSQRADGSTDVSEEQNWRPTGRMRGSLSGRAYSEALSQYIIQPTQPTQAVRPNLPRPQIPPQLQNLVANRSASAVQDGSMAGGSGVLPTHSPNAPFDNAK